IDKSCFPPGISYTQFELRSFIRRRGAFTLIAESRENPSSTSILGFLVAEAGRLGHIITIDVRSGARRYRVGSALLDAAERQLCSAKCQTVALETAVDNIP